MTAPSAGSPPLPAPAAVAPSDSQQQQQQPDWPGSGLFVAVQDLLDRNAVLIAQINDNHASRTPEALARNVELIRSLNANVADIVGLYQQLADELHCGSGGAGDGGGSGGANGPAAAAAGAGGGPAPAATAPPVLGA